MPHTGPLRTPADFERAMAEARAMVKGLETAGPAETQKFEQLLSRIADYHDDQPPVGQGANLESLQTLDGHLKAFGRRWPKEHGDGQTKHWSPMVGGGVGSGRG